MCRFIWSSLESGVLSGQVEKGNEEQAAAELVRRSRLNHCHNMNVSHKFCCCRSHFTLWPLASLLLTLFLFLRNPLLFIFSLLHTPKASEVIIS